MGSGVMTVERRTKRGRERWVKGLVAWATIYEIRDDEFEIKKLSVLHASGSVTQNAVSVTIRKNRLNAEIAFHRKNRLCVTTPIGSRYQSEFVARNCTITIQGKRFLADLILLGIQGYDVILGMDWLTKYRAIVDCRQKTLNLLIPEGERMTYTGKYLNPTISLISVIKAHKLMQKGCPAFLCAVEVVDTPEPKLDNIPIACEFPEVFQELPGLPPDCLLYTSDAADE